MVGGISYSKMLTPSYNTIFAADFEFECKDQVIYVIIKDMIPQGMIKTFCKEDFPLLKDSFR